jgi:electron transfer flavoprotein alpha subunit
MAVLVVADNDNAHLRDGTHKTVTAALKLSGDVDVLVLGKGVSGVAAQAAKIAGVRKVLVSESEALGHGLAEAQADAVLALAGNYDAILVPATSGGKNFAPRVAAKLDVAPISEIVEVVSADTFVRPIYAGNALETVQSSDAKKVITVRPTAFAAAAKAARLPWKRSAAPTRPRPASSAKRWSSRTVRNWPRPRSSSRAAAPWARPRSSRR